MQIIAQTIVKLIKPHILTFAILKMTLGFSLAMKPSRYHAGCGFGQHKYTAPPNPSGIGWLPVKNKQTWLIESHWASWKTIWLSLTCCASNRG